MALAIDPLENEEHETALLPYKQGCFISGEKNYLNFILTTKINAFFDIVDTPRSKDAGILKGRFLGMNPPKIRILKWYRSYPLPTRSVLSLWLLFVPNGLQLSDFSPTKFYQLYQTNFDLSGWGRQDKFALALSSLD